MILIGTSGFSYDDWKGIFYPKNIKKPDMLKYYSEFFNTTEINSTYYSIPNKAIFERLIDKVPEDFIFTVKANKELTHNANLNTERFNNALKPLDENNRLGCVLIQFPFSFHISEQNMDYLEKACDSIPFPKVVEFRNQEWINKEVLEFLNKNKIGFCCVDEPDLKGLLSGIVHITSDIAYIRFHGRNKDKWWKHDEPHERYDYLYKEEELLEWTKKIKTIETKAKKTFIFFNNHYQSKAVINANQMKQLLGLPINEKKVAEKTSLEKWTK